MHNGTDVTDYWEFKLGRDIALYFPPIIIIFGFIGNLLSFLVYIQKKYRTKIAPIYILSLSAIDTVNLLLGLCQYWVMFNFFQRDVTPTHCRVMFFIVNTVANHANWIIVAFTVDRFLAVWFPFWTKANQTTKRGRSVVVIIGVVAVLKNFHYNWTAEFVYNKRTDIAACGLGIVSRSSWVEHYQIFELLISSLLPFTTIIILNTTIIYKMKKDGSFAKQHRRTPKKINDNAEDTQTDRKTKPMFDYGLTISLLMVSTVFVILVAPLMVLRLYHANKPRPLPPKDQALYEMHYQLFHNMWYSNNAINFFLYSLSGKTFRRDLVKLFARCNQRRKKTFSNSLQPSPNINERTTQVSSSAQSSYGSVTA